jgi:hypothetical protein
MTSLVQSTKLMSFSSMTEASPDLIPVDENFGDTHSGVETHDNDDSNNNNNTIHHTAAPDDDNDDDTNSNNNVFSCLWDLILLIVWLLRRSILGVTQFLRTLMVGQRTHLDLWGKKSVQWIMTRKKSIASSWLPHAWWISAGNKKFYHHHHHYSSGPHTTTVTGDPQAWPPPAFTALALLTVFTLVVHPDGFTWIMLRKLRYVWLFVLFVIVYIYVCVFAIGSCHYPWMVLEKLQSWCPSKAKYIVV